MEYHQPDENDVSFASGWPYEYHQLPKGPLVLHCHHCLEPHSLVYPA
jgi:hypothetical protein